MKQKVFAIVPAAGSGKRFGSGERKQFMKISGAPLLIHTLKQLHASVHITEIVPVLRKEDMEKGREIITSQGLHKIRRIAQGGRERQDSVSNALHIIAEACVSARGGVKEKKEFCGGEESLILVHDGVRPLVSSALIERVLLSIEGFDGVIPGLPAKDTIKEVDRNGMVLSTVDRNWHRSVQTPQVFTFSAIREAYEKARTDGFYATDDAALVERIGGKVRVVEGDPLNIKITTPEDLALAEYFISKRRDPCRTYMGSVTDTKKKVFHG